MLRSSSAACSCWLSSSSRMLRSCPTLHGGPFGLRAAARISSSIVGLGELDRAGIVMLYPTFPQEAFHGRDRGDMANHTRPSSVRLPIPHAQTAIREP